MIDLETFRNIVKNKANFFYPPIAFLYILEKSNSHIDGIWWMISLVSCFLLSETVNHFATILFEEGKQIFTKDKKTKSLYWFVSKKKSLLPY